jgi:predicted house-cleaning noncanonical NTP pyrophosphatase (MazG superfamily)
MKKDSIKKFFKFDKLVRDKLYQKMLDLGIDVTLKSVVNKDQLVCYFKNKILEEAQEVVEADSRRDIIEELADLQEVIYSITKLFDIRTEEIELVRKNKHDEKGGFDNAIIVDSVSLNSGHEFVKYYESNPKKYPIIVGGI